MNNDRPPTDSEQVQIDSALAEAIVLNKLMPDDPMPFVLMAQAYMLSGERQEAVDAINRAVACAPERANVRVSACAIQFGTGHPEAARRQLDEAERLDATLPLVTVWKGMLALSVDRDAATARKCFEATISRVPRFPLGYQLLGVALLNEKNPDLNQVRGIFRRALVLDAKLTCAMVGMAKTYEREGDRIMARLWTDRALVVDARYMPALVMRAGIAGQDGKWPLAITDISAAIALAPFRADLYRLRANAEDKAGDVAAAEDDRKIAAALEKAVPESDGT